MSQPIHIYAADIIGARVQPPGVPNYGAHEGYPVRWLHDEAWVLGDDGQWRQTCIAEIRFTAHWLSKHVFDEEFGAVPPLPVHFGTEQADRADK